MGDAHIYSEYLQTGLDLVHFSITLSVDDDILILPVTTQIVIKIRPQNP